MKQPCQRILLFGLALGFAAGWVAHEATMFKPIPSPAVPKNGWPERDYIGLIRVIDGDTIKVWYHGEENKVRLLNINTPERGKPGYKEATESMEELLTGKRLRIEFENGKKRDNFGRLLGYVFANNVNVNVEQVKRGHSEYWIKYGRSKKYEKEFIK